MSLSKPSAMTLPTTSLQRLTLYKNQLAFTERTAKLTDGLKSANQRSFSLSVPNATRELTMATMSVVAGANVAVMVAHDAPDTSKQHKAAEPQPPYEFVLGAGVGLGNFLASVIGAEVTVSMHDGSALTGQVLLVEEAQRAVPGSETCSESVVESVYSDLQLLSDEGEVVRVAMAAMRSVQVLDPELRRALNEALKSQLKRRRPNPPPSHHTELRITAMHGGAAEAAEATQATQAAEAAEAAELRVSYAAPTKEWLCSYRLDVPAEGDGASLHHFAQVWNTGDEDNPPYPKP